MERPDRIEDHAAELQGILLDAIESYLTRGGLRFDRVLLVQEGSTDLRQLSVEALVYAAAPVTP